MPSLYFRHPQLSEKLLRSRYQTEYLRKFCNDSKSVLFGHRQLPEHVWLEQRRVGSPSFRVDEVPTATNLRPPYASRLSYYDEPINKNTKDEVLASSQKEETVRLRRRCHTTRARKIADSVTYTSSSKPACQGRPCSSPAKTRALDAINKMTLQKYREASYENMIGPRVFFRPTIPPHRHDYVIHPAFHSENKRSRVKRKPNTTITKKKSRSEL